MECWAVFFGQLTLPLYASAHYRSDELALQDQEEQDYGTAIETANAITSPHGIRWFWPKNAPIATVRGRYSAPLVTMTGQRYEFQTSRN